MNPIGVPRAIRRRGPIGLLLLAAVAMSGCQSDRGCRSCNDITPGAIPLPNGTYACQWIDAHAARAAQDDFVVYQYEWSAEETKLTQFGQRHVAAIAERLATEPYPVVIESSSDENLDATRRAAMLEALAGHGVPIDADRVIIAHPEAEGLYGEEAPGIAYDMLDTQNNGTGTSGSSLGSTQGNFSSSSVGTGFGSGF